MNRIYSQCVLIAEPASEQAPSQSYQQQQQRQHIQACPIARVATFSSTGSIVVWAPAMAWILHVLKLSPTLPYTATATQTSASIAAAAAC